MGQKLREEARLYTRMKLAVLILAGGKSSRMGTDKGLLLKDGKTWVEIIKDKLPADATVFISVGKHNRAQYKAAGFTHLIEDKEGLEVYNGPIKGLLSGLDLLKEFDKVLVIPCDMISLKGTRLLELINHPKSACFKVGEQLEPLPFVLKKDVFSKLLSLDFSSQSVKSVLQLLHCDFIEIEADDSFRNYNFPGDLVG
jgi:molybdopterin-guanine dinucleotide biosynthesis protein A